MVTAVATCGVPKITLVIIALRRGSYVCGRAYDPDFLFMWPNAKVAVMGGEQAAGVLAEVRRGQIEAAGDVWPEDEEAAFKRPIIDQFDAQASAYYASARCGTVELSRQKCPACAGARICSTMNCLRNWSIRRVQDGGRSHENIADSESRGDACRIMRTARALGIRTVAVYSGRMRVRNMLSRQTWPSRLRRNGGGDLSRY